MYIYISVAILAQGTRLCLSVLLSVYPLTRCVGGYRCRVRLFAHLHSVCFAVKPRPMPSDDGRVPDARADAAARLPGKVQTAAAAAIDASLGARGAAADGGSCVRTAAAAAIDRRESITAAE